MTIDINSIQNSALKETAQKADSKGQNAFNSNLDPNEISVFIDEAKNAGCEMRDIMSIVNFGVAEDEIPTEVTNKIRLQQDIDNLSNQIEKKEQEYAELERKMQELQSM